MAIERNAHTTWMGDLKGGKGEFDLESSHAVEHEQVTFASRFEQPGGKTSPEGDHRDPPDRARRGRRARRGGVRAGRRRGEAELPGLEGAGLRA
jgi:hypothetical protein